MINIAEMMSDPDFAQEYSGIRTTGTWVNGKFVTSSVNVYFYGPITAANVKDIQMLPEGDRVSGLMVFYTPEDNPFYVSQNNAEIEGISDYLIWRGNRYKVLQVYPYDDYGYMKAIGTRIGGA